MKVLRINSRDTYNLRQKILRPNGTIEDCKFLGDEDDQTFHLGAFINGKLISISSFYFEKHPKLADLYQYRLRGMATLPNFQKQGFSSALINMSFTIIKKNLGSVLWCNARETAVGFYKKLGFEILGEKFEIPNIGPHFLMAKNLIS